MQPIGPSAKPASASTILQPGYAHDLPFPDVDTSQTEVPGIVWDLWPFQD